jgi:hypothetical protein
MEVFTYHCTEIICQSNSIVKQVFIILSSINSGIAQLLVNEINVLYDRFVKIINSTLFVLFISIIVFSYQGSHAVPR